MARNLDGQSIIGKSESEYYNKKGRQGIAEPSQHSKC